MRKGKIKHSEAKKNKEIRQKKEGSKYLNNNESIAIKKALNVKSAKVKKHKIKAMKAKKIKAMKLNIVDKHKSTSLATELSTAFLSNENAILNAKNLNHASQIVNKDLENKGLSYNLTGLIASNKFFEKQSHYLHTSLSKQKENIASLEATISQVNNINHQLKLDINEIGRAKSELLDRITMLESTKKNLETIVRDQRNQISATEKSRLELIKQNSDLLKQLNHYTSLVKQIQYFSTQINSSLNSTK